MNVYPDNYQVSIDVPFVDLNGDAVTLSAFNAQLYDGDDALVVDLGSLPYVQGDGKKTVVIPASFNQLAAGELRAARILRVGMVTDAGTIAFSASYVIQGATRLALMVNSFQTIEAAELLALDMPNLSGFAAANDTDRAAALVEAYNRLLRVPMKYTIVEDDDGHPCEKRYRIRREDWDTLTEDDFNAFPAALQKALRRAQLYEASDLLDGESSIIAQKQAQGIISETVGASSIMLRGNTLATNVSAQTLRYLAGYVDYSFEIRTPHHRAWR